MTRYTNVARKPTYLQAGFDTSNGGPVDSPEGAEVGAPISSPPLVQENVNPSKEPKEKKRKKEKSQVDPSEASPTAHGGDKGEEDAEAKPQSEKPKKSKKSKETGLKGADARKAASERRRLKRQDERYADTTCYACRQQGHAASHCPTAPSIQKSAGGTVGDSRRSGRKGTNMAVGICYRCGSGQHNLSKCRAPVDPANPLPYVSCFVCSANGHLASSCPENQSKGVYPNGGSCKLCGKTTHLAKDCDLRKGEVASGTLFLGTGREAGADEDDFHTFKRKTTELNKEDKGEERRKRLRDVKVGAHSGAVKAFGQSAFRKGKVVSF